MIFELRKIEKEREKNAKQQKNFEILKENLLKQGYFKN
jgi:hypothetical protein